MKVIKEKTKIIGWAILFAGLITACAAMAQDPSEGLVPTVFVAVPNLANHVYKNMPQSFEVGVMGEDPDSSTGRPVRYRFLLISAQHDTTASGDPVYIRTPFEYDLHGAEILSWDHADWSDWTDYPAEGEMPFISFSELPDQEYFLLALQVMDSDGAVSTALEYQRQVFNFRVRVGFFRPEVTICEPFLGCPASSQAYFEIAGGQPLNISWIADAGAYGGNIVSYRHGWDLVDPDDPNDPGWAVPPGLEPENLYAPERSYNDGLHTFFLRVVDDAQQIREISWTLSVVPFVAPDHQFPLLVIDQIYDPDGLTNNWQDQSGQPRNAERFRNPYWQFLEGSGGVSEFDWSQDWMDHRETPAFRDLVMYKAVICYARFNDVNQTMFQQFRPVADQDRYVWLTPYQQNGGNYFQVGGASMESYLEPRSDYMIPIIFDAQETTYVIDGNTFFLGFGQMEMPDGSIVPRGPRQYPYATAGIVALDWTSSSTKFIYGRTSTTARFDRVVDCVGLKGLALAPDFQANHGIAPGALPDTFFTDQVIDWHDVVDAGSGNLNLFAGTFPFRSDEFFDTNITTRPTPIILQECSDIATAPDGMCVEPMFTGISRMDWVREYKWAEGDSDWPFSEYSEFELDEGCGPLGLTSYEGIPLSSSRTHGHTYGFLSYKMVEDKPSNKADVYWGFDPYRFDHQETQKAIRWVLDYFGLNINP